MLNVLTMRYIRDIYLNDNQYSWITNQQIFICNYQNQGHQHKHIDIYWHLIREKSDISIIFTPYIIIKEKFVYTFVKESSWLTI